MRHLAMAALLVLWPVGGLQAAAMSPEQDRPRGEKPAGLVELAQYQPGTNKVRKPRGNRNGYVRPVRPNGGAYRPRPGVTYQPRPGVAYRPGYRPPGYRPGWRPPPAVWRPAYPGWRRGWVPAPWYGNYWRPGYGWGAAAGLVAVGVLVASAAMAYSVPPPPNPNLCWFYTDQTFQTGYWAACPPPP